MEATPGAFSLWQRFCWQMRACLFLGEMLALIIVLPIILMLRARL